jgi:hypothetical protein
MFDRAIDEICDGARRLIAVASDSNEENRRAAVDFDDEGPYMQMPMSAFCIRMAHTIWRDNSVPPGYADEDIAEAEGRPPARVESTGKLYDIDDPAVVDSLSKLISLMPLVLKKQFITNVQKMVDDAEILPPNLEQHLEAMRPVEDSELPG